ncbi:MAG TPA: HU family DNA-binding protein [Aggregatilineales bacterium]|nr:HU family DNA-binding protein [Anaerolineales bacterium]HRE47038.1 HU family DNA-binding protein [Aggregatilineales bacterium]
MQKTELISKVAKDTEMTQDATAKVVNATIDAIVAALKGGDKVTLTGFGTFEVRKTKARVGTNPATRQKIQIPAGKRVSFSAGAVLKKEVTGKGDTPKAKGAKKPAAKKK